MSWVPTASRVPCPDRTPESPAPEERDCAPPLPAQREKTASVGGARPPLQGADAGHGPGMQNHTFHERWTQGGRLPGQGCFILLLPTTAGQPWTGCPAAGGGEEEAGERHSVGSPILAGRASISGRNPPESRRSGGSPSRCFSTGRIPSRGRGPTAWPGRRIARAEPQCGRRLGRRPSPVLARRSRTATLPGRRRRRLPHWAGIQAARQQSPQGSPILPGSANACHAR